jgi:hypothetical protein
MSAFKITHASGPGYVRGLTVELCGADTDDTLLIGGAINFWPESDE